MPNEVEIRITANDLTGPAVAGAIARMRALKSATQGLGFNDMGRGLNDALNKMGHLREEVNRLSFGKIDTAQLGSSLTALKSKIQALGIADIADVNVQPGRIMSQLQIVKRMVDQAGITDLLDVNVNTSDLSKQLDKISSLTETIPVLFDMSKIPNFGAQSTIHVPIMFDVANIPKFGDVSPINAAAAAEQKLATATEAANAAGYASGPIWTSSTKKILDYAASLESGVKYNGLFGDALVQIIPLMGDLWNIIGGRVVPAVSMLGAGAAVAAERGINALGNAAQWAGGKIAGLSDNISKGIPIQDLSIGRWNNLKGHIELFGGALSSVGIPKILAAVSGFHIMGESILEVAATLVPAAVAFVSFGAVAIPTVKDLYGILKSTQTVATAFGTHDIYPLTGGFQRLADSVRPSVYVLFGEALLVARDNTGGFARMVVSAGKALDDLGARFTYAVTKGQDANRFFDQASRNLAGWGNLIGNIGGIFGALFKVMPGYAEILLNLANGFTHVAETVINSKLGGNLIGIGLAAHGALFYIGLLGTAFAILSSKGLGAISGLLEKAAFGVVGLGKAGAVAGEAMMGLSEGAATAAALPWGWISIAAAGIGFLVYQLVTAKSAAQQFADSVQTNLLQTPIQNLGRALGDTLANATNNANKSFYGFLSTLGQSQSQFKGADAGIFHMTASVQEAAQATENWKAVIGVTRQDLSTYRANLATASAALGGTKNALAAMTAAGITSTQFLTTNKQQLAQVIIEAQAYDAALRAATQTSGRYGAAQNALNFVAGDTANALGQQVAAMQKVTQASDQLLGVVVGGEQAFIGFEQAIQGMGADAHVAGASFGYLNKQSLTLAADFYSSAIPAAQKLIDSLNMQAVSTGDLTKVVATSSVQLLQYAGKNETARATVVALINNALGPGTVSLKTLDSWVKQNSTSLGGFNQIVAESTIKAGSLAGVLQNQLNAQFRADLLASSGANNALRNFTDAITHGGTETQRFASARAVLIRDLENTGLSAKDATGFVNGLQRQVDTLHGKSATIALLGNGSYKITENGSTFVITQGGLNSPHAAGGIIRDGVPYHGNPGDDVLISAKRGELIVPEHMVKAGAADRFRGRLPGFAAGGLVGGGPISSLMGAPERFDSIFTDTMGLSMGKQIDTSVKKMLANFKSGFLGPGFGSYAADIQAVLASMGLSLSLTANWLRQIQTESGGNLNAVNLTDSNAQAGHPSVGLLQLIPATFAAFSGPYRNTPPLVNYGGGPVSLDPMAQIYTAIHYAWNRYDGSMGSVIGQGHGYDNGGWLMPGYTMAYNGTGRPERVMGPQEAIKILIELGQSFHAAGLTHEQIENIRYTVRTIGGGDVQTAFGKD